MGRDYAWWYGQADVLGHVARMRDEAETLRETESQRNRINFMLVSGPLMVLAVLFVLYLVRRFWQRRRAAQAYLKAGTGSPTGNRLLPMANATRCQRNAIALGEWLRPACEDSYLVISLHSVPS